MRQIRDGEFSNWLSAAIKLEDGEALNEDWVETITEELSETADLERISDDGRFNLATFAGTYTWNKTSETWIKTTNSSGQMVLIFPATPGAASNNCEFKITEYADEAHNIDGDQVYLPKVLKASLKKENSEIFSLNLAVTYNASGSLVVPVDFNLGLKLSPVTYNLSLKRLTNTQFETKFAFQKDTDCATTLSTVVSFAHDDYENYFDDEEDINTIQAEITKGDLTIGGTWDVKAYNKLADPTTEQTNSTLNLTVKHQGQKTGDLKLKDVGNDTNLFVFYKDGTSENASIYYDPFISDLDNELQDYFGEDAISNGRKTMFTLRDFDVKSKFNKAVETLAFWN
ncbi:MAG: hypothetical protein ACO1O1_07320 [Adhaeribacter sp.]